MTRNGAAGGTGVGPPRNRDEREKKEKKKRRKERKNRKKRKWDRAKWRMEVIRILDLI